MARSLWTTTQAALGLALIMAASPALGEDSVDCDAGGSVQSALDAGKDVLAISGTCAEVVTITRDRTLLLGQGPEKSAITGGVLVSGATGVVIADMAIGGASGSFVSFVNGSAVTMSGSTVKDTEFGFAVARGSFALLDRNVIGGSRGSDARSCAALCVIERSAVRMTSNSVTADAGNPVIGGTLAIMRDSSATLRGGNRIANSGSEAAVSVLYDSSLRQDNPARNSPATDLGVDRFSGARALEIGGKSYADIREAVVAGETVVDLHSVLRVGSLFFGGDPEQILFDGPVLASRGSAIAIEAPDVVINGDIVCQDSATSLSGTFRGAGSIKGCRSFDGKRIKKSN